MSAHSAAVSLFLAYSRFWTASPSSPPVHSVHCCSSSSPPLNCDCWGHCSFSVAQARGHLAALLFTGFLLMSNTNATYSIVSIVLDMWFHIASPTEPLLSPFQAPPPLVLIPWVQVFFSSEHILSGVPPPSNVFFSVMPILLFCRRLLDQLPFMSSSSHLKAYQMSPSSHIMLWGGSHFDSGGESIWSRNQHACTSAQQTQPCKCVCFEQQSDTQASDSTSHIVALSPISHSHPPK